MLSFAPQRAMWPYIAVAAKETGLADFSFAVIAAGM
jgi:hypothetical protein